MKILKILLVILGMLTGFLGLIFLIGGRPVSGGAILAVGGFCLFMGLRKPSTRDVVIRRELELTGDVSLENMKCRQCGGSLSSSNVSIKAGTAFVTCPYCHSEYQLEEAPKW